ncbi:MAG: T9SS type A sorting domain-containing protein [Bacteroidota bacterium]
MKKILLSLLFLSSSFIAFAQFSCDSCAVSLPDTLPADTIFLGAAADGQVGLFYDESISFRVPMTTDPVVEIDSTVPPGLAINSFVINTVSNVPPGLDWQVSQTDFDPSEETDGCIKFCGTPLQPGLYEVEVVLTATIFIIEEVTSFVFPILILPSESTTDGFSLTNNSGCGEVTVSFTNNVPSNGQEGFSYLWDFGNAISSTEENPEDQIFDEPGLYEINYQAIIDTTGHFITEIIVENSDCDDIIGGPDIKIDIIDPNDSLIFVTPIQDNATFPASFSFNFPLGEGEYTIRIVDSDGALEGADDVCGIFTITRDSSGTLIDGNTTINLSIINPRDTINSQDTVLVFEQPEAPELLGVPTDVLCDGETFVISTNYEENVQWYQDSVPVVGGNTPSIEIVETGEYWVTYTSPDGCLATSEALFFDFQEPPASPVFLNENNLLILFDPDILPDNFTLEWYLDGNLIPDATTDIYCAPSSGNYELVLIDESTGCSNFFDLLVNYDPDFENCVSSTNETLVGLVEEIKLFPNPAKEQATITFDVLERGTVEIALETVLGQKVRYVEAIEAIGNTSINLDLETLPKGLYLVRLRMNGQQETLKLLLF